MALNKEIWLETLIENLYADNSFVSKSIDDSSYVDNKTVHIPNAGRPSKVVKNNFGKAESIGSRTDSDLTYSIDDFKTLPILITDAETAELSYDKRSSVLANDKEELQRIVHMSILENWADGAGQIVKTTGEGIKAHTHSKATGKRKAITRADVLGLMTIFNKQELPLEGRTLLLDAEMYAQLLGDMSESDKYAFWALADAEKGILGKLYSFDIMLRSTVLRVKNDYETILKEGEEGEATECAGALAWHSSCVSRALGGVKMFERPDDPEHYGSVYSFEVRAGGYRRRADKKGIVLLVEDTAA